MKTVYLPEDIERAHQWYKMHKDHVDNLMKCTLRKYPMSGSDIAHPELWKPSGWLWFFDSYPLP
jgi:hypothetical protein